MTIIRTDLGDTKENAARLRFEPNASIPDTNVQDAIVTVGGAAFTPATVVVNATSNITNAMTSVQTNQAAAIVLTLPDSIAWEAANGKFGIPLSIFDISGNAETNAVQINASGGQTIGGLTGLTITTNYGGFNLRPRNGGGWLWV